MYRYLYKIMAQWNLARKKEQITLHNEKRVREFEENNWDEESEICLQFENKQQQQNMYMFIVHGKTIETNGRNLIGCHWGKYLKPKKEKIRVDVL